MAFLIMLQFLPETAEAMHEHGVSHSRTQQSGQLQSLSNNTMAYMTETALSAAPEVFPQNIAPVHLEEDLADLAGLLRPLQATLIAYLTGLVPTAAAAVAAAGASTVALLVLAALAGCHTLPPLLLCALCIKSDLSSSDVRNVAQP